MKSSVTLSDDVKRDVFSFVRRLKNILDHVIKGDASITYGKDIVEMSFIDIVRIVYEMPIVNKNDLVIRNLFMTEIIESEARAPGSGAVATMYVHNYLLKTNRISNIDNKTDSDTHDNDLLETLSDISRRTYLLSSKEIFSFLDNSIKDKFSNQIVKSGINLAGAEGKIIIDTSISDHSVVSESRGYNFPVSPDNFFSPESYHRWHRTNVYCLVIDGVVEKISEIDKLIYMLKEINAPAILFARSFNEEVSMTLSTNLSRGLLDIIPVVVPFDEVGINMLNDIAVVLGTDIVSSLKGEIISQKNTDDMSVADEICFSSKGIVIKKKDSKERVRSHIKTIEQKRDDSIEVWDLDSCDKSLIFDKRINSLTSDGVRITLGKSVGEKRGVTLDRVQSILKMFKQISRTGMLRLPKNIPNNSVIHQTSKDLRLISDIFPAYAYFTGIKVGSSIANYLSKLGAIISED